MKFFPLILLCTLFAGCSLPPEEDIICTTPMTNNPHVIPQRAQSVIPGMQ